MLSLLLLGLQAATPASALPTAQEPQVIQTGEIVAQLWQDRAPSGDLHDHYRISLDGGETFSRDRLTSYDIYLRYGVFDPLRDQAPAVPEELAAPSSGNQLWIVQFETQGMEPWREWLRQRGAVDHRFLGMHAGIWEMPQDLAKLAQEQDFVRWVGPFHPAYKLENELFDAWQQEALLTARYNVVVGEWGLGQKEPLADQIRTMGGTVHTAYDSGWIVSATLTPSQLMQVVANPMVLGLDRWSAPEQDMDIVRNVMGANYVETVGGYTGLGVRAEVMDSGLDTVHADWASPPILHGSVSSGSHGTCTYGINFATGASAPGGQSRGVAPDATGIMADYDSLGNRYSHTAELVNPALQYRAVYQSNSWGGSRTSQYNSTSQEMDDIIYINDISILQSQSNAGTTQSRPQAWAKNIIAVGGIRHGNNSNDADDNWTFGASIGPAADGRIKPDLAAYYDSVWTSDADSGGYVSGDDYQSFSGTSAATPIVAGHLALIYQMWAAGEFGNVVGPGDVFDNRPHNTTAKALLLNSTKQWTFSGAGHDLTRVHQGWGKPDLTRLYDNSDDTFVIDESDVLTNLGVVTYDLTVPAGAAEFRATMIYTDRAGTTSSNLHRINDLSLRVTAPNGLVYWGNNGLNAAMTSTSGGVSNTKDTVEQVIVSNPVAGVWTVDVFADEVNQDTHPETPALDADFSLVVTPVTGSTGGQTTDSISLTGVTNPMAGFPYAYQYSNAPANAPVWLLGSSNNAGTVYAGHDFDLGAPISVIATGTATVSGDGTFFLNIPSGASGVTFYLEIAALSGGTWSESADLQLTIQ